MIATRNYNPPSERILSEILRVIMLGFLESPAPVAKRLGITLSLIEPGPVNTNFVAQAALPGSTTELQAIYRPLLESYMGGSQERFAAMGQMLNRSDR